MKNQLPQSLFIFIGIILLIIFSCKKEIPKVAPTIETSPVTNITASTATTGGVISTDGGSSITECGVCWGTNPNPTTTENKTKGTSGIGPFTCIVTGLTPGTNYYIKAYAINNVGITYGNQVAINTISILSVVTTDEITSFTATSITVDGNISNDGGAAITGRGVCWGTKENPSITDNKTSDGTGIGNFASTITGLTSGSNYYVRAYSTNSTGTSYGNQLSIILPKFKNYLQPSYYLKESNIWVDLYKIPNIVIGSDDSGTTIADFNGDGYDDVLIAWANNVAVRSPLELYLNDKSNKKFVFDNSIIHNNVGTESARKAVIGDFNKDGKPDVFYADHGAEPQNSPFLFAYPSILMSTPTSYDFKILDNLPKAFTHGACAGDFDYDGDLDIFTSIGYFLINDGKGNFTKNDDIFNYNTSGIVTCEMYDVNNDGYLDLIVGGHTMVSWELDSPKIFWGNGINFREERSTSLPDPIDWEVSTDFCFEDLNNDGYCEIIINRCGGAAMADDLRERDPTKFYVGSYIQILESTNGKYFTDETNKYIQNNSGFDYNIIWLRIQDIDNNGYLDLFNTDKGCSNRGFSVRWEQDVDGVFKRKYN